MSLTSGIMEFTHAYRLWQAPFAEDKFAPVLTANDLRQVRRVLDVGCGPGTNARHFADAHYIGIDCDPAYIQYAKRRHPGEFVVADATTYQVVSDQHASTLFWSTVSFTIPIPRILVVYSLTSTRLLTEGGHLHVLELALAKEASVARWPTLHDRGEFPRPRDELLEIISQSLHAVVEPYDLEIFGLTLWNMVYLKCRTKT